MSIQRYLHGRSYATDCTCERGLRPAAAKCICLRLAHVRPYKTAHYSRVMPRTHVAASFFFSSTLCELPLKASRRPFLHASFLSSLSSFPRCPLLFSCFFAFLSSSTSFLSSPFFFLFFSLPYFYLQVPRRRLGAQGTCDTCKCAFILVSTYASANRCVHCLLNYTVERSLALTKHRLVKDAVEVSPRSCYFWNFDFATRDVARSRGMPSFRILQRVRLPRRSSNLFVNVAQISGEFYFFVIYSPQYGIS